MKNIVDFLYLVAPFGLVVWLCNPPKDEFFLTILCLFPIIITGITTRNNNHFRSVHVLMYAFEAYLLTKGDVFPALMLFAISMFTLWIECSNKTTWFKEGKENQSQPKE
jgi:hypothetical protein